MLSKLNFHKFHTKGETVATVTTLADLNWLSVNGWPEGLEWLEFRLDNLAVVLNRAEEVAQQLLDSDESGRNLLFTARRGDEGGVGDLELERRLDLLRKFRPLARAIDLEVRSLDEPEAEEFLRETQAENVAVLASWHDFDGTPDDETLEQVLNSAEFLEVNVTKLAFQLKSMNRMMELAARLETLSKTRAISMMGMGRLGKLSRLVFAAAGSVLNYGYLQEANAPGQWQGTELARLIAETRG